MYKTHCYNAGFFPPCLNQLPKRRVSSRFVQAEQEACSVFLRTSLVLADLIVIPANLKACKWDKEHKTNFQENIKRFISDYQFIHVNWRCGKAHEEKGSLLPGFSV